MEKSPKQIPIELKFGAHGYHDTHLIHAVSGVIQRYLNSNSKGLAIIFSEDAWATREKRNIVFTNLRNNGLPSQAYAEALFVEANERRPTPEELELVRTKGLLGDSFTARHLREMDSLYRSYPNRLRWATEVSSNKEVLQGISRDEIRDRARTQWLGFFYEGEFAQALPPFQKEVEVVVEDQEARNPRIVEEIKGALRQKGDILALAGFLGANHSGVAHRLRREGYMVSASFPESERGVFTYLPVDSAIRERLWFPEKISSEEKWLKLMVGEGLVDYLLKFRDHYGESGNPLVRLRARLLKRSLKIPKTNQGLVRNVWRIINNLAPEDITELEANIQSRGPVSAITKLLRRNPIPKRK